MSDISMSDGNLAVLTMLTDHGNSIREMSRSMDAGFADIRARLENKADKGDVQELRVRISQLETHKDSAHSELSKRIDEINMARLREEGKEQHIRERQGVKMSRRQILWSSLGVMFLVSATIIASLISAKII